MDKRTILIAFSLLVAIILISNVFALTASIGNARMVLRTETGEKLEKYILVKNVNDVPVDIELIASGDLENYIDIKDDNFRLEPEEDKKAYFTIDVRKAGTSETKINVRFTPDEGNGVGFSSTIIVIAKGEDLKDSVSIIEKANEKISLATGKVVDSISKDSNSFIIMMAFTLLLLILLVIIVSMRAKRAKIKPKKSGGK